VRESQSNVSKGFAFISFVRREDAENAIQSMNGQWLGSKAIRTNWATRKPVPSYGGGSGGTKPLSYEEVSGQASESNSSVYCGGILNGISEELIHSVFGGFGAIDNVRVFKDKGYAFIKFTTKEAAVNAIVAMHGADVNGYAAKCSWGKEANGSGPPSFAGAGASSSAADSAANGSQAGQYSQQYPQQPYPMGAGYWGYPQPYMPPYGYPAYGGYGGYGMPMGGGWPPAGPMQPPYGSQGYPGQQ